MTNQEERLSEPIYATTEVSQCKGCIYNEDYKICKYYKSILPDKYLFNEEKCLARTLENKK